MITLFRDASCPHAGGVAAAAPELAARVDAFLGHAPDHGLAAHGALAGADLAAMVIWSYWRPQGSLVRLRYRRQKSCVASWIILAITHVSSQ